MPTGGGKSITFQVPALAMEGICIVVTPLIALMKDQVDNLRRLGIKATAVYSGMTRQEIIAQLENCIFGDYKFLYVSPERLGTDIFKSKLQAMNVCLLVIDESHCISQWGYDFRPSYLSIADIREELPGVPVLALTATATPEVVNDIQERLHFREKNVFRKSFVRKNLSYIVRQTEDKINSLIYILGKVPGTAIVYVRNRKRTKEIAALLQQAGISADFFHAGLNRDDKNLRQSRWKNNECRVIVSTNAFGMGIDKPDVRFVIHYDIPKSIEGYYQETGRAGRDGQEGQCITFYSYKDIQKLEKFMQGKPIAEQEIGKQLLMETVAYAESNSCRRKLLLNYFGEDYTEDNCGACDNCLHPKKQFDGQEEMCMIIELIQSLPERFKIEHLANILAGVSNSIIKSYRHDKLELFGAGKDHTAHFWSAVIHQGIVLHLLHKDIESYGLISVTGTGAGFLESPHELMLTEDREFAEGEDDDDDNMAVSAASKGTGGDPQLLAMLKDLRKSVAGKRGLQPWVVFSDPSLEDMAILYPITIDELKNCQGVGDGKARKFGKEFIELIAKYVDENEIMRPDDFVMKSIVNKSVNKVFIIQSVDRKLPLEDIADAKGMDMEELLDEIEAIVYSGTKLNLDYFISQAIDEEVVDDIYGYFKEEAESDSLEAAMDELGSGYDETEVRLVRIKFLCEVAN